MTHPGNRRPGGTPPPSVPLSPGRVVRPANTGAGGSSTPPSSGTTGGWLSGCFLIVAIPTMLLLLTAAKCVQGQDGPGKPDDFKPSRNVWIEPSGTPKPLPSGMKTAQQPVSS